jgi:hypothetical protein
MTELLTVLIGLTWILALVGVPAVGVWLCNKEPRAKVGLASWVLVVVANLIWLCYRVGLTVRPWLVEVLK